MAGVRYGPLRCGETKARSRVIFRCAGISSTNGCHTSQAGGSKPRSAHINLYQPRSTQINPDQPRTTQINPDQLRSTQIKPDQSRSTQINSDHADHTDLRFFQPHLKPHGPHFRLHPSASMGWFPCLISRTEIPLGTQRFTWRGLLSVNL